VLKIIHKFRMLFRVFIQRSLKYWISYFNRFGEIKTNVLTTWWPPGGLIGFKLSFKFELSFRVS
jgi:hypothetical protein